MRQAEKRALMRRNVLRAAQDVFGRSGYHQATLRDIAEEAGVSKGAVYYNFASKEELFLALLDARMDERLREIRAVNSEPDHAARDYIENVKRNREWITLFFEFVAHAARDNRFGAQFATRFKRFWAELADDVERRAREQGVDLPLPAEQLAIAIDVLGIGFMIPQIIDPGGIPDDLLPVALTYMLRGVAQAAAEQAQPPA